MDQQLHQSAAYDYRPYDRLWQRVAPGLEPYPAAAVEQAVPASSQAELSADQTKEEENEGQLPGAVPDRCPWQPGSACGIWQQRRQVTPGD